MMTVSIGHGTIILHACLLKSQVPLECLWDLCGSEADHSVLQLEVLKVLNKLDAHLCALACCLDVLLLCPHSIQLTLVQHLWCGVCVCGVCVCVVCVCVCVCVMCVCVCVWCVVCVCGVCMCVCVWCACACGMGVCEGVYL